MPPCRGVHARGGRLAISRLSSLHLIAVGAVSDDEDSASGQICAEHAGRIGVICAIAVPLIG
jgi:hypothetical protein